MKSAARLQKKRARNQSGDSIAMTPMIDVVFQMLIYFVLTFEVPDRMSQMSVWRPGPDGDQVEGPKTIFTTLGVKRGAYSFNDQVISLEKLEAVLHRLSDLDPRQNIVVTSSGDSAHHELVTLLNLMKKSGLNNVSLVSVE